MGKQAGVEIPEPVLLQGSEEALEALVGEGPQLCGGEGAVAGGRGG